MLEFVSFDSLKRAEFTSALFRAITIIDDGHAHPGENGDYPPCVDCDIDVTEQISQFRRANAGSRNQWK